MKKKVAFILGIRPDIIRASLILKHLKKEKNIETIFIWSGQHHSDNLKDIFFRELGVDKAAIELNIKGNDDSEIVGNLIPKLYKTLQEIKPDAAIFLGDTNTVIGTIAAAQLNIPIVHIEGCMRSYDWRMPEEKYRTVSDHLSDIIYTYFDEYKEQGVREGLNPKNIVVVGNPIVDVINKFYFERKKRFEKIANKNFFKKRGIEKNNYYVLTCHRRENVEIDSSFDSIVNLLKYSPFPIYFPASYRTQKKIKQRKIKLPNNIKMVDPIGYEELITLMVNSRGVLTDSGTIIEEASILQIPAVQLRKSTERPQVYDVNGTIKFDPTNPSKYDPLVIYSELNGLYGMKWKHILGDGKSSERIANDLKKRILEGNIKGHEPKNYHFPVERSYSGDKLSNITKKEKVLVTGGGGYIGTHVVEQLLNNGYKVRIYDQFVFGKGVIKDLIKNKNLEVIVGDIDDTKKLKEALTGIDFVIHLAGIVGDPASLVDKKFTIYTNITLTKRIKDLSKKYKIKRFIFASSCSVYGSIENIIDEKSKLNPVSLYARTKIDSEKEILSDKDSNFHPTVLRFATVYGHSRRPRFDLVANLFAAQAYYDGIIKVYGKNQWRPFVHVSDIARAIVMILDSPLEVVDKQIFNVGDNNQNFTIGNLAKLVSQVIQKDIKNRKVRVIYENTDYDKRNYKVSFNKIKNAINFEASVSVEEGIKEIAYNLVNKVYKTNYNDPVYINVEMTKLLQMDKKK